MASSYVKAELAATCSSLGRLHHGKYVIDSQCYESVRDLIRFLRRDDEYYEVRRYLGEAKVVQSDLIHIVTNCPTTSPQLFDITVRLLVNLTNPVLLLYREEVPIERVGHNLYMTLVAHTQDYKIAFCDIEFWSAVCAKLTDLFEVDWSDRSEDDSLQIERLLVLLRNVLQVPADTEYEKRPENDITVHDKVLWALRQSQILELLLYVSSSADEVQYYLHLLEIFSLILREQNPNLLAQSEIHRSTIDKERDANDLIEIREREKATAKNLKNMRNFSTTYVLKNVKSISDQDVIIHKSLDRLSDLKLTQDKKRVKTPKNRVPAESERKERRSTFSVRLFLKEFCVEFLNCSFNNMMAVVKDKLMSGKGLSNDESYYFWALKFFLEFNCAYNLDVKLISECVNAQTFHFLQTQMESCFERLISDKKKAAMWVRRIHLMLKAYHSLLKTLHWMDSARDGSVRDTSKVLKSNIFYVPEYRELMLYCLLRYDPFKYSTSYLRDLIETSHLFLRLLEDFCKRGRVVVQKKKKAKGRKKQPKEILRKETNEEKWEKAKTSALELLRGETVFPEIAPFDALLDIPISEQQEGAVKNIQKMLHRAEVERAIGLLRSAREMWPEGNVFGFPDMPVEEEAMLLQEICLAEVGNIEEAPPAVEVDDEEEAEMEYSDENEEMSEQGFDVKDYIKRLANKKVVEACCVLLRNYKKNSNHTNHCAVKLLHRVGWECAMPAMLFQASFFITLMEIFNETNPRYHELQTFAVHLVRKFRENATTNPRLFMEILFWKDPKVAFDAENGYGKYEESNKLGATWTEEEEVELRRLWGECVGMLDAVPKIKYIKENLGNESRSVVAITKKLKQMDLLPKAFRAPSQAKLTAEWLEEEVTELRKYYDEVKDAADPVALIMDRLTLQRPKKRIKEKLLELGLVGSLAELRKKSKRRGRAPATSASARWSASEEDSDSNHEKDDHDDTVAVYSETEQIIALRNIEGMTQALEWLKETMTDCLDDDDESTEGYPLLAMDAPHFEALDNDNFVEALRKLGLSEPVDQQIYWKIMKTSKSNLKEKIKLIEKCIGKSWNDKCKHEVRSSTLGRGRRGSFSEEEEAERGDGDSGTGSVTQEGSNAEMSNRSQAESNVSHQGHRVGSDASDSEASVQSMELKLPRCRGKKKARRFRPLIDSDRSDEEEKQDATPKRAGCLGSDSDLDGAGLEAVVLTKPKRRRCIGSDSEVEEARSGSDGQTPGEKFLKRARMIDSDSDFEGNGSLDEMEAKL